MEDKLAPRANLHTVRMKIYEFIYKWICLLAKMQLWKRESAVVQRQSHSFECSYIDCVIIVALYV